MAVKWKSLFHWTSVATALLAVLGVELLVAGVAIGVLVDLKAEAWAAWVQAIGSIIAIGASVGIVLWQQGRAATQEARKAVVVSAILAQSLLQRVEHAIQLCQGSVLAMAAEASKMDASQRATRIIDLLDGIDLPDDSEIVHLAHVAPGLASNLLWGRSSYRHAIAFLRLMPSRTPAENEAKEYSIEQSISHPRKQMEAAVEHLRAAQKGLEQLCGFDVQKAKVDRAPPANDAAKH